MVFDKVMAEVAKEWKISWNKLVTINYQEEINKIKFNPLTEILLKHAKGRHLILEAGGGFGV